MLEVRNLHVYYGGIHALRGVSFSVPEKEIICLIGANGAGKSTVLRAISGLLKPRSGDILFKGESLLRYPAFRIVEMGVGHIPEGRRVFANLTVQENLELGAYARRDRAGILTDLEQVFTRFPRLAERRSQPAGTLSGGEQQMLAIGRALMSRPTLMVMDEPSMGLAPLLVREIFSIIRSINAAGTTVLLVEQNAHMALSVSSYAYVLETGTVALEGPAAELAGSEKVRKAYLGA